MRTDVSAGKTVQLYCFAPQFDDLSCFPKLPKASSQQTTDSSTFEPCRSLSQKLRTVSILASRVPTDEVDIYSNNPGVVELGLGLPARDDVLIGLASKIVVALLVMGHSLCRPGMGPEVRQTGFLGGRRPRFQKDPLRLRR